MIKVGSKETILRFLRQRKSVHAVIGPFAFESTMTKVNVFMVVTSSKGSFSIFLLQTDLNGVNMAERNNRQKVTIMLVPVLFLRLSP